MDNGANLHDVTVSMLLTNQLSGTSAGSYPGNWSLQLNAYSPNGFKPAITQFVMFYGNGVMAADIESYASNDLFLGYVALPTTNIASSALTTGTKLSITTSTNSTGNVIGVSFNIVDANGKVLWAESSSLASYSFLEAPMVGFETILVGFGGGSQSIASFTQATGQFLYQSSTPLSWTATFPGSLSWVQYKNIGSSETSNLVYLTPLQVTSNEIAQSFTK